MKAPHRSKSTLTLAAAAMVTAGALQAAPVIYEPFAYGDLDATAGTIAGDLDSTGGTLDIGLDGLWAANSTSKVVGGSLMYGTLDTTANSIGGLSGGQNRYGGARAVSASALAGNGLLDDGAILWFSAEMGYDTGGNVTNSRLAFALANNQFSGSNFRYNINDEGAQLGSGIGVTLGRFSGQNGRTIATEFRDPSTGTGFGGNIFGTWAGTTLLGAGEHSLFVGKITWGENPGDPDLLELFNPDTDLEFPDPTSAISVLSGDWDQTTYDTITFARGDKVVLDEIRFGATYNDVIAKDLVGDPDTVPPFVGDLATTEPSPFQATFAVLPTAVDDSTITMSATIAHDPSGVEYLFTETTGNPGATISGWQDSPNYTDVGLSPSTLYTYTIQTRDKSVAQNTGTASAGEDATTPAVDFDPPTPDPMTFASVPAAISNTEITMTASTATDDTYGVEYYFTETSPNPGGSDSDWQSSPTYVATGLDPSTSYTYTVTARDTGPLNNAGDPSGPESATTFPTDNTAPSPNTWATAPTAVSDTEITMTATTATDDQYAVEYYFANLSVIDGSHDSGWQSGPVYIDTGLSPFTSYTYRLTVRDTSYAQNESVGSPLAAVTNPDPAIVTPSLLEGQHYIVASNNNGGPGFNLSVFPGAARYSGTTGTGGPVTSSFGDGTPLDYNFFQNSGGIVSYADGGEGFISLPTATLLASNRSDGDSWTVSDPGGDFLLNPADFTSNTELRSQGVGGVIEGSIDISRMSEGIIYFVYGAYRGSPQIDLVMSGPGQSDLIVDNAGDTDFANNQENYVVAVNFLNAGDYDTVSYSYTSGGSGHQRWLLGIVLDGEAAPLTNDYSDWAAMFPAADLSDPDADLDGDGLTNDYERIFGLDPTTALSHDPIVVPFDDAAGTFSFSRRDDALTGLFSDIETSIDLEMWTGDADATLVVGDFDASTMIETVNVFITPGLLTAPDLFVRVNQNDGIILAENFEASDGGFTVATTAGTDWELGDPDSQSPGGTVTAGNGGSANAWGTNLGDFSGTTADSGFYDDSTVTRLRSAIIDLTGVAAAELLFAEAMDLEAGDTAVVNIIDDTTDAIIAAAIYTADDSGTTGDANWNNANGGTPITIPAIALGQPVRIEWSLTGFGGGTDDYLGWYIDDVSVKETTP